MQASIQTKVVAILIVISIILYVFGGIRAIDEYEKYKTPQYSGLQMSMLDFMSSSFYGLRYREKFRNWAWSQLSLDYPIYDGSIAVNSRLLHSIDTGNIEEFESALISGASVYSINITTTNYKLEPIWYSKTTSEDKVNILYKILIDSDLTDDIKYSMADKLIDYGYDVKSQACDQVAVAAVKQGSYKTLKWLYDNGVDFNSLLDEITDRRSETLNWLYRYFRGYERTLFESLNMEQLENIELSEVIKDINISSLTSKEYHRNKIINWMHELTTIDEILGQ